MDAEKFPNAKTITRVKKCYKTHKPAAKAEMEGKGWTYKDEVMKGNYVYLTFERQEVHIVDPLGRKQVMRV